MAQILGAFLKQKLHGSEYYYLRSKWTPGNFIEKSLKNRMVVSNSEKLGFWWWQQGVCTKVTYRLLGDSDVISYIQHRLRYADWTLIAPMWKS